MGEDVLRINVFTAYAKFCDAFLSVIFTTRQKSCDAFFICHLCHAPKVLRGAIYLRTASLLSKSVRITLAHFLLTPILCFACNLQKSVVLLIIIYKFYEFQEIIKSRIGILIDARILKDTHEGIADLISQDACGVFLGEAVFIPKGLKPLLVNT